MYRGRYNELLRELVEYPSMLKVMGLSRAHDRMADRQLILRFFAMWRNTHLKYKSPMKRFLNREMEDHRDPSNTQLKEMRDVFCRSIDAAWQIFGQNAFRRYRPGDDRDASGRWETRKLNVALWDTVLYSFSYFDKGQLIVASDSIREDLIDLMTQDTRFEEYVASTGDATERVRYRAETWLERLRATVQNQGPRSFSLAFKESLFELDPTCLICNQRIHDLDDSEVDHIKHYWRGGKTIPENARLTHRYCNRVRGGGE